MTGTVITVGAKAPVFETFADFLDGISAVVRRAGITIVETPNGPVLEISPPETDPVRWPLDDLRTVPEQAGKDILVLAVKDDPVARLIIKDEEAKRLLKARARNLKQRPPVKGKGRLFAWAVAAICSVALIIFVLVPAMADQLAEYLPPEGEKALGDKTFEQIRTALSGDAIEAIGICDNPDGVAALATMQARLEAQTDLPYPLEVHVLDHHLINAFALPGGRVVIFRGLIDAAESPDEVAAVFAHEIGHVVNRDPARGALRSAGSIGVLGLVFGDFAGGTAVLFMVERLIDATYSQDAESKADAFAHKTLISAGIRPSALGTMFERLRDKYGQTEGIVAHFQAHPQLGDRIETANAADAKMTGENQPSLSESEWAALQKICG